jgi:hypothetical protein
VNDNTYKIGDSNNRILMKILRRLCEFAACSGSDRDYKIGDSNHTILRKILGIF